VNKKIMTSSVPVITIDGASGTGKGVVMQWVAKELGWNLLDSGALYRVLALAALNHQISLEDELVLEHRACHLDVQFIEGEIGEPPQILLENEDVTETIRTEKIGNAASKIGALPLVRKALLDKQRAFRTEPGLVTDGRDMGTVVFPDANLKIFLTASPEERALRRLKQLKEKGIHVNLPELIEELSERDKRDRNRAIAPLKPADDAICIDTDKLTIEQVVQRIMQEAKTLL
jgi:cytidylate kinase